MCERPGGYGVNHRRVRRQEEIIWLRENDFDFVVSILAAPHNLHNYDELGMPYRHHPLLNADDMDAWLKETGTTFPSGYGHVEFSYDFRQGGEGDGWLQVNAELAFERSGPERIYSSIALLEHWIACVRRSPNAAQHAVLVGQFATHLATLRRMSIAVLNDQED